MQVTRVLRGGDRSGIRGQVKHFVLIDLDKYLIIAAENIGKAMTNPEQIQALKEANAVIVCDPLAKSSPSFQLFSVEEEKAAVARPNKKKKNKEKKSTAFKFLLNFFNEPSKDLELLFKTKIKPALNDAYAPVQIFKLAEEENNQFIIVGFVKQDNVLDGLKQNVVCETAKEEQTLEIAKACIDSYFSYAKPVKFTQ